MGKVVIINNRKCNEKDIADLKQILLDIGFEPGILLKDQFPKSDGMEYKDMSWNDINYLMSRSKIFLNLKNM